MMMKKIAVGIAAVFGFLAVPAHADFVVMPGTLTGTLNTLTFNEFVPELMAEGFDTYSEAATLAVSGPSTVTYYAFGSESWFEDSFTVDGVQVFTETDSNVKTFYGLQNLGSYNYTSSIDNLGFLINGGGGTPGSIGSTSFAIFYNSSDYGNLVAFGYDDLALTDDNHDDLIIFARIVALVPEPASWALMIVGFGVLGAAVRRRHVVRA